MKEMNKDASVTRREEEQEMELFREQRILHTAPSFFMVFKDNIRMKHFI